MCTATDHSLASIAIRLNQCPASALTAGSVAHFLLPWHVLPLSRCALIRGEVGRGSTK
jgi:hypothetical protein